MSLSQNTRQEKNRELYGSEPFTEQPAIQASEATVIYYDERHPAAKYFPLDKIIVANQSNVDVEIWLDTNPNRKILVESNTQEIYEDILPFRSYKVINTEPVGGTDISSGELSITTRKKPMDANEKARRDFKNDNNQGIDAGDLVGFLNFLG